MKPWASQRFLSQTESWDQSPVQRHEMRSQTCVRQTLGEFPPSMGALMGCPLDEMGVQKLCPLGSAWGALSKKKLQGTGNFSCTHRCESGIYTTPEVQEFPIEKLTPILALEFLNPPVPWKKQESNSFQRIIPQNRAYLN